MAGLGKLANENHSVEDYEQLEPHYISWTFLIKSLFHKGSSGWLENQLRLITTRYEVMSREAFNNWILNEIDYILADLRGRSK